jgi:hypothetical protein
MDCVIAILDGIFFALMVLPHIIQGGPTLTIFAITRFLIIEKILRLARKRHTLWSYKPVPLFYLLSIGFPVKRR